MKEKELLLSDIYRTLFATFNEKKVYRNGHAGTA